MTTAPEDRTLARIPQIDDPAALRNLIANARGKSDRIVRTALRRLVSLSTDRRPGTVEYDCWSMIHTIEELRRMEGRVWRMNRLRPKIAAEGEVRALAFCAEAETDGFHEILAYGLPELTAEAIVLRHPSIFPGDLREVARQRLQNAGVVVSEDGRTVSFGEERPI
ncbi:MAG: hypothetical protein ACK4Z5_04990 [Brevundimonas sp.]